jgi:hypothetical protein
MKFKAVYVHLIILLFSTCKDPYDLKVTESIGNLVVDGKITDSPGPYLLKLGKTSGILKTPTAVIGAQIKLIDNAGHEENYKDLGLGNYLLPGSIVKGVKGGRYQLDIVLKEGTHYQSTEETMPILQATDSAFFKVEKITIVSSEGIPVERQVVNIYLTATFPNAESSSYFRWDMDEVYRLIPTCFPSPLHNCPAPCYVPLPVSSGKLQIVQTADFTDKHLSNVLLQSNEINSTFLSKHYFNVNQYSMNKSTYDYWRKVQGLVERTGSIFDTPPANLPGNIHNVNAPTEIVFGYFEASLQRVNHVGVARGYIQGDIDDQCLFRQGIGTAYQTFCLDCTTLVGSTRTQPSWFK